MVIASLSNLHWKLVITTFVNCIDQSYYNDHNVGNPLITFTSHSECTAMHRHHHFFPLLTKLHCAFYFQNPGEKIHNILNGVRVRVGFTKPNPIQIILKFVSVTAYSKNCTTSVYFKLKPNVVDPLLFTYSVICRLFCWMIFLITCRKSA